MKAEAPDAEIIARSVREPELFALIFDRHHVEIHNFVRRRIGEALADDVLSETFVQAFRARSRYAPRHDTCRPWLYGIASHLVANHHRAETRRLRALAGEGSQRTDIVAEDLEDRVAQRLAAPVRAELMTALLELKPRDREVLLLYAWAELSYEEIAGALGLPVGTVRSRLNRARTAVRSRLGMAVHPSAAPTGNTRPGEAHAH